MSFLGLKVKHVNFGNGKVVNEKNNNLIDVKFDNGEVKMFKYPDSFQMGLSFLDNVTLNKQAEELIKKRTRNNYLREIINKNKQEKLNRQKSLELSRQFYRERNRKKFNILYHEAGHALIAEFFEENSVEKVAHTRGAGNKIAAFVMLRADSDLKKNYNKNIHKQIMISLGGMAAVDVVFGQIDMEGAATDLRNAGLDIRDVLLKNHSESEVDYNAIVKLRDKYYKLTKRIIKENRGFLEEIARRFQKKALNNNDIKIIRNKLKKLELKKQNKTKQLKEDGKKIKQCA